MTHFTNYLCECLLATYIDCEIRIPICNCPKFIMLPRKGVEIRFRPSYEGNIQLPKLYFEL